MPNYSTSEIQKSMKVVAASKVEAAGMLIPEESYGAYLVRTKQILRAEEAANAGSQTVSESIPDIYIIRLDFLSYLFATLKMQIENGSILEGKQFQIIVGHAYHIGTLDLEVLADNKIRAFYMDSLGFPPLNQAIYTRLNSVFKKNLIVCHGYQHDLMTDKEGGGLYRQIQYSQEGCQMFSMDFAYLLSKADHDQLYKELDQLTQDNDRKLKTFTVIDLNKHAEELAKTGSSEVIKLFRGTQSVDNVWNSLDDKLKALPVSFHDGESENFEEAMQRRRDSLVDQGQNLRGLRSQNLHIQYKYVKAIQRMQKLVSSYEGDPRGLKKVVNNIVDFVEIRTPVLFKTRDFFFDAKAIEVKHMLKRVIEVMDRLPEANFSQQIRETLGAGAKPQNLSDLRSSLTRLANSDAEEIDIPTLFETYDNIAHFTDHLRRKDSPKYEYFTKALEQCLHEQQQARRESAHHTHSSTHETIPATSKPPVTMLFHTADGSHHHASASTAAIATATATVTDVAGTSSANDHDEHHQQHL